MSLWLLIPRDPLIFRDGRPFTAVPGERARSRPFPLPSTLAGAIRTMVGIDPKTGKFDKERIPELKDLSIRGPFLVELEEDCRVKEWLFPAPADALLVDAAKPVRYSLAPLAKLPGTDYNLDGLYLVGPARMVKDKPISEPPRFWRRTALDNWLLQPADGPVDLDALGISGPVREARIHVSITPGTQTALPGALFQTSGLEFLYRKKSASVPTGLGQVQTLALAVETDAGIRAGLGYVGGERRMGRWQPAEDDLPPCPPELKQAIVAQAHCRLLLVTPAYFEHGFFPKWLGQAHNLEVKVQAVALPRYQTQSGWDYNLRRPKPTRRLTPAGSVYFLSLQGDRAAREAFVDAVWLQSISDTPQPRLDGYGLALLGTWDGKLRDMEVNP